MADDDIVVCGIGGRFPGADNVDEFWTLLTNGENHLKDIPPERCNIDKHYDPDPNKPRKSYVKKAALIKNIYEWDYSLYGISEREAQTMDPQQRLVLDSVYMAMEDAGITTQDMNGSQTAVFIGAMNDDFKATYYDHAKTIEGMAATGLFPTLTSARVSYVFNLLGTAVTIDTACSSSLVAIHMACQTLKCGECEAAIAGGVNFINDPLPYIVLSKARMLSPSGQCHTFSQDADGYARGEGCGIVILKKLKQALKDGNPIWGILSTATNQDGRTATPVNAPSKLQQFNLLKQIYSTNNVNRDHIQVIEAHGTGTPIGDPTETDALGVFFNEDGYGNRDHPIMIGSVKTNIGHLESAAGVTGLIKVLLMMKHKVIVPSLMYNKDTANPRLQLEKYQMEVAVKPTDWLQNMHNPRMACVNSFGFGGTNAHAIVKEFDKTTKHVSCNGDCKEQDAKHIIVLSATDEQSLIENVKVFQKSVKQLTTSLHAVSHTSTCRRTHHNKRVAFLAKSDLELQRECIHFISNPKQVLPKRLNAVQVVFFFCGVGTSWNGMAKELLGNIVFEAAVTRVDQYLIQLSGLSIIEAWSMGKAIKDPMLNHLSIFTYQVGLVTLWNHWGIKPDVVVGQSVGEVAAAYCSGALELKYAVEIIFQRSKALAKCTEGTMLVVRNVPIKDVRHYCSNKDRMLTISGYNSPTSCVVSGEKEEILEMRKAMKKYKNAALYDIDTPCAYHSPYVEKAALELEKELKNKNISCSSMEIAMISSVTGKQCGSWEIESPLYWMENVRKPVQLHTAITTAKSLETNTLVIEIGPRPVLRAHIQDIFSDSDSVSVIPSILKENESEQLKLAVSTLFMHGLSPNWTHIVNPCCASSPIPRYAFSRHLAIYQMEHFQTQGKSTSHSYVSKMSSSFGGDVTHVLKINKETTPFVFQHFVKGIMVVPGATYADVGFEIGKGELDLPQQEIEVSLDFISPVRPGSSGETELVVKTANKSNKHISFVVMHGTTVACKGTASRIKKRPNVLLPFDRSTFILPIEITHDNVYNQLKQIGFEYGACLKQITSILTDGVDLCIGHLTLHASVVEHLAKTHFHACVLDCALQVAGMMIRRGDVGGGKQNIKIMPIGIGKLHVSGSLSEKLTIQAVRINRTVTASMLKEHYNMLIYDEFNSLVASIENAAFFCNLTTRKTPDDLKFRIVLEPLVLVGSSDTSQNVIMINGTEQVKCSHLQDEEGIIHVNILGGVAPSVETIRNLVNSAIQKKHLSIENIAAIVYCCDSTKHGEDIEKDIYTRARKQCKTIGNLVEMLNELPDKPAAFVVTERVYAIDRASLLGSEVWGYLRTVLQEYMYLDITIIDISPSLEQCYSTLVDVVRRHILLDETTPVELAINDDQLLAVKLVQAVKKQIMPLSCRTVCTGEADLAIKITNKKIFSVVSDKTKRQANDNKWEKIEVEYICLHNPLIYPRTETVDIRYTIAENKEDGNTLLALEFVGSALKTSSGIPAFAKCDVQLSEQQDSGGEKWRTAVLCPAACTHVIAVPKECTVSLRKCPWYKPGLLTLGTVCYSLAKLVPTNIHFGVICNSTKNDDAALLFSLMMKKRKQSIELIEVSDLSTRSQKSIPDTVVVLRMIDDSVYKTVKDCKEIICLNCMISAALRTRLCIVDNVLVTVVDENFLFTQSTLKKTLPNVVKILSKTNLSLNESDGKENNALFNVPSDVIRIKSESLGCCLHEMRVQTHMMFRKDSIYVVTGGLTGLGWELVLQMVEIGAGVIVTFGRRPCSEQMAKTIQETEKAFCCSICPMVVDVTDAMSVSKAFGEIHRRFPFYRVRGIIHGAGVVKSQLFANRTDETLAENMNPKVVGTINLHNATKTFSLDYFVMHSSINSVFGGHGQSAYGAANSFMNSFAQWRREQGLPALSINWGALAVGMAAKESVRRDLENRGHILLTKEEIRDCFIHALLHDENMAIYAHLDKAVIARDFSLSPMIHLQHKLEFLREDGLFLNNEMQSQYMYLDINAYQELYETEKHELLSNVVCSIARSVFGCSEEDCSLTSTCLELGLDSMTALVFSDILFETTNYRLRHQLLFMDGHTLNDTVSLLSEFLKHQEVSDEVFKSDEEEQASNQSGKRKVGLRSTRRASRKSGRRLSSSSTIHSGMSTDVPDVSALSSSISSVSGVTTLSSTVTSPSTIKRKRGSKKDQSRVLPRTNSNSTIIVPKFDRQNSEVRDGLVVEEVDCQTQF